MLEYVLLTFRVPQGVYGESKFQVSSLWQHKRVVWGQHRGGFPKLDGVAPLMTDPPPISSISLSKKKIKNVTCDT